MNNYNNPYRFPWFLGCYPYFENFTPVDKPPTLYAILNSRLNYDNDEKIKTYDFAENGRSFIFDFDYDLSDGISKSEFETLFIDRFLERRIGFETFNSFKIHLRAKLREILPYYNKLLDSLIDLKIIYDDEFSRSFTETINTEAQELLDRDTTNRSVKDQDSTNRVVKDQDTTNRTTENSTSQESRTENGTAKTKFSDTPQGLLSNVENNRYMTDYTDVTTTDSITDTTTGTKTINNTGTIDETLTGTGTLDETLTGTGTLDETVTGSGTDDYQKDNTSDTLRTIKEESKRPFPNHLENFQKYLETKDSILTLLYNDLDELFFQIY